MVFAVTSVFLFVLCSSFVTPNSAVFQHLKHNHKLKNKEVSVIAIQLPFEEDCDVNEKWYSCLPRCPITCSNVLKECVHRHSSSCESGCDCRSGYARKYPDGPCISVSKCQEKLCRKNEEWLKCGKAPRCDTSCPNSIGLKHCFKSHSCPEGCFCRRGYARDPNSNQCIKISKCLPEENERCGSNEERHSSEECECMRGFIRHNGACVCPRGFKERKGRCVEFSDDDCRSNEIVINGRCERLIECGSPRKPGLECGLCRWNVGCGHDCRQICTCNVGFELQNGVCTEIPITCLQTEILVNGRCEVRSPCTNAVVGVQCGLCAGNPQCLADCQQICICNDGFESVQGVCTPIVVQCDPELILLNNECVSIAPCEGGRYSIQCELCAGLPDCAIDCQQFCKCFDGYEVVNGVCTEIDLNCPEGQIQVNGICKDKIMCNHGTAGIECGLCMFDPECTANCFQKCICYDGYQNEDNNCVEIGLDCERNWVQLNGMCVMKLGCIQGEPDIRCGLCATQPLGCSMDCEQYCICYDGYTYTAVGVCTRTIEDFIPSRRFRNKLTKKRIDKRVEKHEAF